MKINKSITITIGILTVLLLVGALLFYFRNPQWSNSYEFEEYSYLEENLYNDNGTYKGTVWLSYMQTDENYIHIHPLDNPELDIKLLSVKREATGADFADIVGSDPYPFYLSISFNVEEKNVLEEILCTYIKGDICNREYTLTSWRVYENTYPFPEMSEEQANEYINWVLDSRIENVEESCSIHDIVMSYRVAQYAYMLKSGDNQTTTEEMVSEVSNYGVANLGNGYLYLNLIPKENPLYTNLESMLCENVKDLYLQTPKGFVDNAVHGYSLLANELIKERCSQEEHSISIDWSQMNSVEPSMESVEYRDFVQFSLFCSYNTSGEDLSKCTEVINTFIGTGYVTALNSPVCKCGYSNELCSREILYSLKLFLLNNNSDEN